MADGNFTTEDCDAIDAACQESFDCFAQRAFEIIEPGTAYEWNWHIGCISEHLEASFRGELPWLIINVSPRTLKSVLVAQLYPAWVLGKDPHHQFIGASYAHSLAERNVMRTRQVISDGWYQSCFPNTRISNDQNQKDYFTTTKAGQYKGTGIGGTITGFGCDTLLLDDALNPKEGTSETIRNNTNSEIRSTLFSRFNDRAKARFIMIMQRIHEDDPTGNLMRDERYHLLKLPAEAKSHVNITLGKHKWEMQPGEYLTQRLGKAQLDELRVDLGEYGFVGQYLQEPVPAGGGEFRNGWIQYYQSGGVRPKTMNIVILVDPSGGDELKKKKKKTSDWSAYMVVGLGSDQNYYILDMVRDRLNPTERVDTLFMLHKKWNDLGGKPPKVGYEKYGMMTDTHYIKTKQRDDGYNFPLIELGGSMAKEERIRRLIPDLQTGRWYFPANLMYVDNEGRSFDLVKELVSSEMPSFPRARFDDMLDALSRVYEADLMLSFPAMKQSETQKVIAMNAQRESDNWLDF